MSISEKQQVSVNNPKLASTAARDVDPLLRGLNDKKQSFRRNVVSLASELKELRNRLASQEQSYVKETRTRQVYRIFVCFELLFLCLFVYEYTDKFSFLFFCFPLFGHAKKIITFIIVSIISTFGVFVVVGSRKIGLFLWSCNLWIFFP